MKELNFCFDIVNKEGSNLLHLASNNKNISLQLVKFLVENKVDMNQKDILGNTPLHVLSLNKFSKQKILQFFVNQSFDINSKNFNDQLFIESSYLEFSDSFHDTGRFGAYY